MSSAILANASALGTASLLSLPRTAVAEAPPEVSRLRLVHVPTICLAPEYLAEELLRLEGFSDVEYVKVDTPQGPDMVAANRADVSVHTPPAVLPDLCVVALKYVRLERELADVQRELKRLQDQGDSGNAVMALLDRKQRMIRALEAMKPPKELQ